MERMIDVIAKQVAKQPGSGLDNAIRRRRLLPALVGVVVAARADDAAAQRGKKRERGKRGERSNEAERSFPVQ